MRSLLQIVLAATMLLTAPAVPAETAPDRDPRNWPTVTRLQADRHELAGRVLTLRVFARRTDYYNCEYRHRKGELMAFTLLGGPLETLTGYMPRDLGKVLERQLEDEPWLPITVQVRYDPERLSETCPDQVDVLKWSRGWEYPAGTLSPGRPDPAFQPSEEALEEAGDAPVWKALTGRVNRHRRGDDAPTEEELLGEEVEVVAGARLSTAYHCAFRGATRTHYAVRLHDDEGRFVHAYVPRTSEARALMDRLALHRDVLLEVEGRVVKQVPSNYCRPQLQVTGWSLPDRGDGDSAP
ncbi:MAG: hypothetical protein ACQEXJ_20075 [Myxococcota bacterium]